MKQITILLLSFLFIQHSIISQETIFVGDTELEVREVIDGLDVPWEMKCCLIVVLWLNYNCLTLYKIL